MSNFSDEYRRILTIYQNDKTVNEICKANGISKTKFVNSYDKIETIEIFMGKFRSLRSLVYFPGLVRLTLIKHEIHRIEGLNNCVNLRHLYLHENRIRKISGLDHLPMLKELYLYNNEIEKIEGLDNLPRLEILWLSENRISEIENLEKLKRLRELNLGRNRIEHIGSNLSELPNLEDLNIAGNRIGQFKEIPPLNNVRSLRILQLKSTMYGENPICTLCNYQTYVIYHLRQIKELDQVEIGEQARHLAEATFLKKKMYYNMRIKTLKRNMFMVESRAKEMLNFKVNQLRLNLNILIRSKKELERELEEIRYCSPWRISSETNETSGSKNDQDKEEEVEGELEERYSRHEMKIKLNRTKEYIRKLNNLIELIHRRFQIFQETLQSHTVEQIRKFLVELQTGGNIRIEEGKPGDVWFQSCIDLVKSRFHPRDFDPYFGIKNIKVSRVMKVHNRFLRNRFEEHLESIVDISDKSYKRSMEYLFFHSSLCPISNPYSSTSPIANIFTNTNDFQHNGLGGSGHPSSSSSTSTTTTTTTTINSPLGFGGSGSFNSSSSSISGVVPITSEKVEEKNLQHIYHVIEDGFPNTKVYERFGMNSAISVSNSLSVISIPRFQKIRTGKGKNYLNILLSNSYFSLSSSRKKSSSSSSSSTPSSSVTPTTTTNSSSTLSNTTSTNNDTTNTTTVRTGGRGKRGGSSSSSSSSSSSTKSGGNGLLPKKPSSILKGHLLIAKVFLGQYSRETLSSSSSSSSSYHNNKNNNNGMDEEEEQQRHLQQQISQYSGRVMYRKNRKVSSLSRSAVIKRMNKKMWRNNNNNNGDNKNDTNKNDNDKKNGLKISSATYEKKGGDNNNNNNNINNNSSSNSGTSFFRSPTTRKRVSSSSSSINTSSSNNPNSSSSKNLIQKKYYKNCDSVYRPAGGSSSSIKSKKDDGGVDNGSGSSSGSGSNSSSSSKQKLWFVFDYRMLVPEYLVEFEYQTSSMSQSQSSKINVMKSIMKSMNLSYRETSNNNNSNNNNNGSNQLNKSKQTRNNNYSEEKGSDEMKTTTTTTSNNPNTSTKNNRNSQVNQHQRKKRYSRSRKYQSSVNKNKQGVKSSGYNPQLQTKKQRGQSNQTGRPNGRSSHRKSSTSSSGGGGGGSSSSSGGSNSTNSTSLGGSHSRFKKISSEFNFLMSQFQDSRFTHIDLNDLFLVSVPFFEFAHFLHVKVPSPKKYEHIQQHQNNNNNEVNLKDEDMNLKPYSGKLIRVLNLPPKIQPRKSFPKRITYEDVKTVCRTGKITSVTYLNLFNQKISSLEGLSGLIHLRILKLGFNEITSVKEIVSFEFLDTLDLSYNLIKRLDGLEGFKMKKLRKLELNNNLLYRFDDVEVIRTSCPKIERLSLFCNIICDLKSYRYLVIRKLQSSLKVLDGKSIGEHEKRKAIRLSIFVTNKLLKKHAVFAKDYSVHLDDFTTLPPFHGFSFSGNGSNCSSSGNGSGRDETNKRQSNDHFVTGTTVDPFRYFSHSHPYSSTRPSHNFIEDSSPGWEKKLEEIDFSDLDLRRIKKLRPLTSLRKLSFARNSITRIEGLSECSHLQELNLEGNRINKIEGLTRLIHLRKLHMGNNLLKMLENVEFLIRLTELSIENNLIGSLQGISKLINLMELYCSHNKLEEIKEVHHLRTLSKLIILDLSFNGLCKEDNYRLYVIYNLRKLKVLDGLSIDSNEIGKARQEFSGKLTLDLLQERLGHSNFLPMTELDLSSLSLKVLHPHLSQNFPNLEEVSLDHNNLSTVYGISNLSKLVVLNLNHNKIEVNTNTRSVSFGRYVDHLVCLEQLSLDNNIIESMMYLQLHKLPRLRVLSLRHNKIHRIEGLTGLRRLEELLLDKNKLKYIDDRAFQDTPNLRLLHLEENSIRYLSTTMGSLHQLRSLYMSCNRIIDLNEFEKLSGLELLEEVVFSFNPIARKSLYRATLIYKIPSLRFVDGKEIGEDERERAEIFFSQDYFSGMTGGSGGGQGMMQQYHQYVSRSNRNDTGGGGGDSSMNSRSAGNNNNNDENITSKAVSRLNIGSSSISNNNNDILMMSGTDRKLLLNQKVKVNNMQLEYLNLDGHAQPVDTQIVKGYDDYSTSTTTNNNNSNNNRRRISKHQQQQQPSKKSSIVSDLIFSKKRSYHNIDRNNNNNNNNNSGYSSSSALVSSNSTSSSSHMNSSSSSALTTNSSSNRMRNVMVGVGGGGVGYTSVSPQSLNSGSRGGPSSSSKRYSSTTGGNNGIISSKYGVDRNINNSSGYYSGIGRSKSMKKYSTSQGMKRNNYTGVSTSGPTTTTTTIGPTTGGTGTNVYSARESGLYKGSYSSRGFLRNDFLDSNSTGTGSSSSSKSKSSNNNNNNNTGGGGGGSTKYKSGGGGYRKSGGGGGGKHKKVSRITQLHFPRFGSKK